MTQTAKHNKTLTALFLFFTGMLIVAPFASRAGELPNLRPITSSECRLLGVNCPPGVKDAGGQAIANYLWRAIQAALALVATVTMGFLVYSGYLYVISRGNEQDAAKAKNGIAYALIGLAIIGLAGFLVNAIINI